MSGWVEGVFGCLRAVPFDPDWVVHPGATLDEWMETQETPWMDARDHGIPAVVVYRLLIGEEPIDPPLATKLEEWTRITASFWLNYETKFRSGIHFGKHWDRP